MQFQNRNEGYVKQAQKQSTRDDHSVKVDPKQVYSVNFYYHFTSNSYTKFCAGCTRYNTFNIVLQKTVEKFKEILSLVEQLTTEMKVLLQITVGSLVVEHAIIVDRESKEASRRTSSEGDLKNG